MIPKETGRSKAHGLQTVMLINFNEHQGGVALYVDKTLKF